MRCSFPKDKLLALKARLPELDADFVLTGQASGAPIPPRPPPAPAQGAAMQAAERRGRYAPPMDVPLMTACLQAVADEVAARALSIDHRGITSIASAVYEMSIGGGVVNPRLAGPMLDVYLEGRGR
jgi:hypothetical protein